MRAAAIILAVLLGAGCQSAPRPAAGMAGLRVHVLAEPKAGAQPSAGKVTVYDTPAPVDYGAFAKVDYSDLDQIVVWLEPVTASAPPSFGGEITVDIDPSKASRGIGGVASVGQRIVLHNTSSSSQTIYSVSDGNEFDLESVPPGGRAEYTVRSAGLIEILTNSAKENPVQIYAAPTPWVRMTRSGESVEFNNLPPGQYRLVSWHPRLPGTQRAVTLSADRVSDASIDVTVNTLPKVNSGG
jgi:hypothetical protein